MLASVSQSVDPETSIDLLSGRLATFGLLLGVLIILLTGWAAIFNYLRSRHKLRMREPSRAQPPKLDPWAEAGRRFQSASRPRDADDDERSDDDGKEPDDDDDDDGDVPTNRPPPTLTPANA